VASSGMMFIQSFVKIFSVGLKLLGERQACEYDNTIGLSFLIN
jgi:hypothetical protein